MPVFFWGDDHTPKKDNTTNKTFSIGLFALSSGSRRRAFPSKERVSLQIKSGRRGAALNPPNPDHHPKKKKPEKT